jgi:hypothetical protein
LSLESAKKAAEGISGTIAILAGVVAQATGLQKNIKEWVAGTADWPDWAFWVMYAISVATGLLLILKWRSRHSQLIKPDALRLDRDNAHHLVGREDDLAGLIEYTKPMRLRSSKANLGAASRP